MTPSDTATGRDAAASSAITAPAAPDSTPAQSEAAAETGSGAEDPRRQKSSPLVRRIAKEHNVDISGIPGSGSGGRVTKADILGFIERGPAERPQPAGPGTAAPSNQPSIGGSPGAQARPVQEAPASGLEDRVEPMGIMRRKIADHMILSRRTSAHVYSVFEVNYTQVDKVRKARREEFERAGVKLTFTSFIAKVAIDALRRHPVINASLDGDTIVYKRDVNLGIAVALDNGLIVPVVKRADEKNLFGLSRAIADVADRARRKKLNPEEVQGGTFTITNPGTFGAQFGLPIINQPQVAILGVGTIEKRPVVIDDMIGIRLMGYLTLGYDHRLIDGAVADQFMAEVKRALETFEASQV